MLLVDPYVATYMFYTDDTYMIPVPTALLLNNGTVTEQLNFQHYSIKLIIKEPKVYNIVAT